MFDQRQGSFDRLQRRGGEINCYQNIADLQRGWRRSFRGFSANRDAFRSRCHFHVSITNIPHFDAQPVLPKAGHFLFSLESLLDQRPATPLQCSFPRFSLSRSSPSSSVLFVSLAGLFFDFHTVLALTSILHVFSNAAKLVLFGRHMQWRLLLLLGIPSIGCVILGALLSSPADG